MLDFEAALRERVGLLKGLPVAVIDRVIRDRITLMPGGRELVATMRANGAYAALVSGGPSRVTVPEWQLSDSTTMRTPAAREPKIAWISSSSSAPPRSRRSRRA